MTAGKLRLARAAAAQGVAAADWQAMTRCFDVQTRVQTAYYEILAAQREVQTHEEAVRIAEESLDGARKLQKAGPGTQPDVLRAEVEVDQNRLRLGVSRQRLEAGWRLLTVAVGVPNLPVTTLPGTLEQVPPAFDWQATLQQVLVHSTEVQEAQALALQAEQLLLRARAEPKPNVTLTARPYYSFPAQDFQILLEAGSTAAAVQPQPGQYRRCRGRRRPHPRRSAVGGAAPDRAADPGLPAL